MNNDLISRNYIVEVYNRVKEACKNCDNYNGVRCRACDIGDELLDLQDIIDNAPLVKAFTEEDMAGAYNEGYACGSRENTRPQGEWEDYSVDFYRCPECGYLLNKDCPHCQNKVILPKGGAE